MRMKFMNTFDDKQKYYDEEFATVCAVLQIWGFHVILVVIIINNLGCAALRKIDDKYVSKWMSVCVAVDLINVTNLWSHKNYKKRFFYI